MRLRILQVSDAYYPFPGGVTEHMHNLSISLRQRGHEVKILTGHYGLGEERFDGEVIRVGKVIITSPRLKIFNLTQLTLTFSPKLHLIVRDFLKRNHFDIVHTHGPLALNLPHLALHYSRALNVATFHTSFLGFNFHKLGKFLFFKESKRIHLAIAVSPVALKPLKDVYRMPFRIIPNGISLKRFRPDLEPIPEIMGMGGPRILFLGRLEPRKGLVYILRALRFVLKEFPGALLVVGGTGPLERRLRAWAEKEYGERVRFLGFIPVEQVPRLYRSVDLYTSPAIGGETFGIVLLEAMACGIPVVASDIPGYRSVIRDGENGILAKVTEPEEYAIKIIRLLKEKELREHLVEEGLRTAIEHSWERIAQRVEDAYIETMEGKREGPNAD